MGLRAEIRAFTQKKHEETAEARQRAALFLSTGIDLAEAIGVSSEERRRLLMRLTRLLERERQRGARRHWSYDLNRHISLKQALDRLRNLDASPGIA